MSTTKQTTFLNDFLAIVRGSKEVGLALAKDKFELSLFVNALEDQWLKRSEHVADLFLFSQTYIVLDRDGDKDIYDFAVQYPTGQVEIFDKERMQSQTLSSSDENRCFVMVAMKDDIDAWRAKGFDLLSVVGPTYQT